MRCAAHRTALRLVGNIALLCSIAAGAAVGQSVYDEGGAVGQGSRPVSGGSRPVSEGSRSVYAGSRGPMHSGPVGESSRGSMISGPVFEASRGSVRGDHAPFAVPDAAPSQAETEFAGPPGSPVSEQQLLLLEQRLRLRALSPSPDSAPVAAGK